MSCDTRTTRQADPELDSLADEDDAGGLVGILRGWLLTYSPWWLVSAALHCFLFLALACIGADAAPNLAPNSFEIVGADLEKNPDEPLLERSEAIWEERSQLIEITTDTLTWDSLSATDPNDAWTGGNDAVTHVGGGTPLGDVATVHTTAPLLGIGTNFDFRQPGSGPAVRSDAGPLALWGEGREPGSGGPGQGFKSRSDGLRKRLGGATGNTKTGERSVAGALAWIARHQLPDGRWSFTKYPTVCRDASCTGPGQTETDTAASALGLLPFLGAGQTHQSKGPYRQPITSGLAWLMRQQKSDGDLRGGGSMYAHGLATIALCEAYGMTGDRAIGYAAQAGINFLQRAQNQQTGGWRYLPGEAGDTSVVGWQLMALKSGLMAGLTVDPAALDGVKRWLKSVDKGYGGKYSYRPEDGTASPTMTAVGLLCAQYLGARPDDPGMREGSRYLMAHRPDQSGRNLYYWYYATQVMHNLTGPDWDTWNREMRRTLIDTQSKSADACSNGSWDPTRPTADQWGQHGGRLMMTSLGALTLEVYYRYLPLYKLDREEAGPSAP